LGFDARDLKVIVRHIRWENFSTAIAGAIGYFETASFDSGDHFRGVTKMVV
jgi:DNA-damage-inducible protein D